MRRLFVLCCFVFDRVVECCLGLVVVCGVPLFQAALGLGAAARHTSYHPASSKRNVRTTQNSKKKQRSRAAHLPARQVDRAQAAGDHLHRLVACFVLVGMLMLLVMLF